MLAVILAWTTLPLWRAQPVTTEGNAPAGKVKGKGKGKESAAKDQDQAPTSKVERRWSTVVVALAVPALAVGMYGKLSNWDWDAASARSTDQVNVEEMLRSLEQKLEANPDNAQGWLMLGRSYMQLRRYARGVDAYQHAYDLTKGENIEAITGLGEALIMVEPAALAGRAGQLFDDALAKDPRDTRALWFGGMAALQTGQLRVSRDRFVLLLEVENLPEDMRTMLQGQVAELNGQLGEAGNVVPNAGTAGGSGPSVASAEPANPPAVPQAEPAAGGQQRTIKVSIKLAPNLKQQVTAPLRMFVLARDPSAPGPPLAVQRHSSDQLPMTVTLSESDAMTPARTLASAQRVTIVARLSVSGMPQQQSGDFFGEATYEFGKNTGTVQITIDQRVP
jgi:cytochrome c-type biogenesis protein CcmH